MNSSVWVGLLAAAATVLLTGQVIRGRAPSIALLLSIAGLLVLFRMISPVIQTLQSTLEDLLNQSGLNRELFTPLLKVLAITQITRISAELCRDAGERGLAAKLELCGGTTSLLCILPLAQEALKLIGALRT